MICKVSTRKTKLSGIYCRKYSELAFHNLHGVSNQYRNLDCGLYRSFCQPSAEKLNYKFDDQNSSLTTAIYSFPAYLLFFELAHTDNMNLT